MNSESNRIVFESVGHRVFYVFLILFMVLLAFCMAYPYLNVVAKAFNNGYDTVLGGITIYPRVPTIENFSIVLSDSTVLNSFLVSVARVLIGTLLALIVQFSSAYAFTKKSLKGRGYILVFFLIPMFFGGGLIPQYLVYSKLKLLNNFLVYVLPGASSMFNIVLIRTYLYTIPESCQESAKLDGASEIVIMTRIMLPLAMPILATVALWVAVGHWNDWTTTLYFVTKDKLFPLQYVLMRMLKQYEELNKLIENAIMTGRAVSSSSFLKPKPESLQAAQIVISTLPIIIVYPFLQKYFIKGIMVGALKD